MGIKTFIDYVVSDDPNKYPSDGLHTDGYYYEKVVGGLTPEIFGCTKMAIDTYTPTSDVDVSTQVPHSLGELPKIAFIIDPVFVDTYKIIPYPHIFTCTINSQGMTKVACMYWYQKGNKGGYINSNASYVSTSEYLKMNANDAYVQTMSDKKPYYASGHTYTIITMA